MKIEVEDQEDKMSDNEADIAEEVNEIDGVVKMAKEHNYEQDKDSSQGNDEDVPMDDFKTTEVQGRFKDNIKIQFSKQKNKAQALISFSLDVKKVLILTIAEQTMQKCVVKSIKGIEKCTFVEPKKESEEPMLIVQGINFEAFYPYQDIIDVSRIETNHSYALRQMYGVEAMRANIVKEVTEVFGVYGIQVDPRHLSLIGDFMTFNGDYRAFNRIGMQESSSPFLKMSYETTMQYLVGAS